MSADDAALGQAAAWYALLQAGDATPADRARWERWLAAAPAHQAAWQKIEAVNRQFGSLPARPALAALRATLPRRAAVKTLLVLAGAGTLAARPESAGYLAALAAGERTGVGEMRQLALADGSALWMNTDSALDLDFAATLRRVVLHRGEILLRSTTVAQPTRALVVDVQGARLTALGTRFSVLRQEAGTWLSVFDGAVRVALDTGATRIVTAGTRLRFGPDGIGAHAPADPATLAWTAGRLSADNMRLGDFIAMLARYRHGHLGCDPAVAGLLLTGSYPLHDTGRILAALENTLPVRVRQVLPWWATLEAA